MPIRASRPRCAHVSKRFERRKSVGDVIDFEVAVIFLSDNYYVEKNFGLDRFLFEIYLSGFDDVFLFAFVYNISYRIDFRPSGFNLDKSAGIVFTNYYVDLFTAVSPVSFDNDKTEIGKEFTCCVFAFFACCVFVGLHGMIIKISINP